MIQKFITSIVSCQVTFDEEQMIATFPSKMYADMVYKSRNNAPYTIELVNEPVKNAGSSEGTKESKDAKDPEDPKEGAKEEPKAEATDAEPKEAPKKEEEPEPKAEPPAAADPPPAEAAAAKEEKEA